MVKRPPPPESLRERILRRDAYRCVYCGLEFPAEALTLDHVQPRMRGGDRSEGNLVAACRSCNVEKGSAPAWSYLAERPEQRENFLRYAQGIWPRHRRAILEAVDKRQERADDG
ncbi:MAG: HNH endonuclease signature motif containing protein [Gemmatimonadota bacterium]